MWLTYVTLTHVNRTQAVQTVPNREITKYAVPR